MVEAVPAPTSWMDVAKTNSRGFWRTVFKLVDRGRIVSVLVLVVLAMFFVWGSIVVIRYPSDSLPGLVTGISAALASSLSVWGLAVSLVANVILMFAYKGMRDTMQAELDRAAEEKRALHEKLVPAVAQVSSSRRKRR